MKSIKNILIGIYEGIIMMRKHQANRYRGL